MTVIGTSTNLLIAGLVVDAAAEDDSIQGGIGFFEPGYIGEKSIDGCDGVHIIMCVQ